MVAWRSGRPRTSRTEYETARGASSSSTSCGSLRILHFFSQPLSRQGQMSLAHVKEALPKLVQQCPEGEIRHLLQLADDRLHGLEGKGPAVRVSKTDLLRALSEELPDEVERSTADHAAIALLNRERSRHERFDIRLAELSKHRMKRDAGGPSTLCKAVG